MQRCAMLLVCYYDAMLWLLVLIALCSCMLALLSQYYVGEAFFVLVKDGKFDEVKALVATTPELLKYRNSNRNGVSEISMFFYFIQSNQYLLLLAFTNVNYYHICMHLLSTSMTRCTVHVRGVIGISLNG